MFAHQKTDATNQRKDLIMWKPPNLILEPMQLPDLFGLSITIPFFYMNCTALSYVPYERVYIYYSVFIKFFNKWQFSFYIGESDRAKQLRLAGKKKIKTKYKRLRRQGNNYIALEPIQPGDVVEIEL